MALDGLKQKKLKILIVDNILLPLDGKVTLYSYRLLNR